jgi:hypothetical protein
MGADVWAALVKGYLSFAQTRAGNMAETSAAESVSLVGSLIPGVVDGRAKDYGSNINRHNSAWVTWAVV